MEKQYNHKIKGTIYLLLAAILWGASFVFQNEGVDIIPPFAFNGIRSFLGSLALLPVIGVIWLSNRRRGAVRIKHKGETKTLIIGGLVCGLALCIAGSLQTLGITQGAGEAGFITTIYIVFVPILGVFLRQRIPHKIWLAVMMCFVGLYLLCGSFAFNTNQIYLLLCAFFFAIHILTIDYFSPKVDGVKLSCLQFFVVGVIDCIIMVFAEKIPTINDIIVCFPNLAYAGFVSCSVAYTFQIIGQKYIAPTVGAIIMSLESVFSVISEMLIQGKIMPGTKIFGCAIIFAAVILAQIPDRKKI